MRMKSLFTILILCVVATTQAQTLVTNYEVSKVGPFLYTTPSGIIVTNWGYVTNEIVTTNSSVVATTQTNETINVSNATEALGAFIHFELPSVNLETGITFAGGLMAFFLCGAKYLRKIIPDKWQVNKLGLVLGHIAGEINPTIAKLALAKAEEAIIKITPAASESKNVPPVPIPIVVPTAPTKENTPLPATQQKPT